MKRILIILIRINTRQQDVVKKIKLKPFQNSHLFEPIPTLWSDSQVTTDSPKWSRQKNIKKPSMRST